MVAVVQSVGHAATTNFTLTGVSASNVLVIAAAASSAITAPAGFVNLNAPTLFAGATNIGARLFINTSPTAGTNSVTISGCTGAMLEISGLSASPVDVTPAGVNTTGASTGGGGSVSSGTLAQASEIIIAILGGNETGAGSTNIGVTDPPTGFTSIFAQNDTTAELACEVCYQIVSSTASVTATWAYSDTPTWVTQMTVASLMANAGVTKSLTALTATFSQGTIAPAVAKALTGQTATFTEGTITATTGGNVTKSLTALTATFSQGTLGVNVSYLLDDGLHLGGQTATFTEGQLSPNVTYTLTGQTATFTQGALSRAVAAPLVGQTATFSEGSITANVGGNVTKTLSALTATFTQGAMAAAVAVPVTGQSATFTQGSISRSASVGITALTATFAEGTISRSQTGPITIQLGSLTASFTLGTITSSGSGTTIRVQAVYDGTYGGQFYEAGDVFDIASTAFSDNAVNYGPHSATIQLGWMIQVSSSTPLYQARTSGITSIGTWLPPADGGRRTVY